MRTMIAAAALVLMSGKAWAESTQADWDKNWDSKAQPLVNVFARCVVKEADRMVSTSQTAEEIADAAIQSCSDDLKPLRMTLVKPPFEGTQREIDETVKQIVREVRTGMIADIEKQRKE